MELPIEILIHNEIVGFKGREGVLLAINDSGYFEVTTHFGDVPHRLLLPIQSTILIAKDPEENFEASIEIER
jgi:hypothetical protein